MDVAILGGTHHVGRAIAEAAVSAGHRVTIVHRGHTPPRQAGLRELLADRTVPGDLERVISELTPDLVLDTWSGAPDVVRASANLFAARAPRYILVSSRSVYRWPIPDHADESTPVVDGDPGVTDAGDYARAKRGAELAVSEAFPGNHLIARAGLIIGPYEHVGRLPWWLDRLHRGGPVIAPGHPDRALQYVDGRDLASWLLTTQARGVVDAVGPTGAATMGQVLRLAAEVSGARAELVWVDDQELLDHGVQPWTDLPLWLPEGGEANGLYTARGTRARETGLRTRAIAHTVADTWEWMVREGVPERSTEWGPDHQVEQALLRGHRQ